MSKMIDCSSGLPSASNKIQVELKKAEEYFLDWIKDGGKLPELSQHNVALVEAMIQNDSAYLTSSDEKKGPVHNKNNQIAGGSTAFWMKKLKENLVEKKEAKISLSKQVIEVSFEEIIQHAVNAVDKENSTHLNADKADEYAGGRTELSKRIIAAKEKLLDYLRVPEKSDFELIKIISSPTPSPRRPRENVSFASKFCHYACFYLFDGEMEQDNYSIYDGIVVKALPKYLAHYKITDETFAKITTNKFPKGEAYKVYNIYRKAVDAVIKASGNNISRNGFDHILWYYFKGR